jgi:hypothetical protein
MATASTRQHLDGHAAMQVNRRSRVEVLLWVNQLQKVEIKDLGKRVRVTNLLSTAPAK